MRAESPGGGAVKLRHSYRDVQVQASGHDISIRLRMENRSQGEWKRGDLAVGWQLFDPDTGTFISEGEWTPLGRDTAPGETVDVDLSIAFPPEPGGYRVYVSPLDHEHGWAYARGSRFLLVDAEVADGAARVLKTELTTRRALLWRAFLRAIPKLLKHPVQAIWANRALIRSMVRRDILARYRGSFGDVFWTILNPVMLMLTY